MYISFLLNRIYITWTRSQIWQKVWILIFMADPTPHSLYSFADWKPESPGPYQAEGDTVWPWRRTCIPLAVVDKQPVIGPVYTWEQTISIIAVKVASIYTHYVNRLSLTYEWCSSFFPVKIYLCTNSIPLLTAVLCDCILLPSLNFNCDSSTCCYCSCRYSLTEA